MPGFTNRYNVSKLVYYELGSDASGAIAREKQIKAGSRQKKIHLINGFNDANIARHCEERIARRSNLGVECLYRSEQLC